MGWNHIFFGRTVGRSNAANRAHHIVGRARVTDWCDELRLVRKGVVALHFARIAPVSGARLAAASAWEHLMRLKGKGDQAIRKVGDARGWFLAALLERGHGEGEHRGCPEKLSASPRSYGFRGANACMSR